MVVVTGENLSQPDEAEVRAPLADEIWNCTVIGYKADGTTILAEGMSTQDGTFNARLEVSLYDFPDDVRQWVLPGIAFEMRDVEKAAEGQTKLVRQAELRGGFALKTQQNGGAMEAENSPVA